MGEEQVASRADSTCIDSGSECQSAMCDVLGDFELPQVCKYNGMVVGALI